MTVKEFKALSPTKRSKFKNVRTGKYDSRKESDRATVLKILEKQGKIKNLREQVRFELIPAQYIKVGERKKDQICLEKSCSYVADFVYFTDNGIIVEDVKGMRTDVYKIKKKLMLQVHGIRIKEV